MDQKKIYPKKISTIVRMTPRKTMLATVNLLSKLNPQLSADVGLKIFTYPISKKNNNNLFPAGTIHESVQVNNKKIATHRYGKSPRKILCVHGWEAAASDFHLFFAPLVENGYEVMAIDLPGHGSSPRSSLNAREAAEIIYQIEQLYGPFNGIIGHSFGGFSTALALKLYPELENIPFISIGAPNKLSDIVHSFASLLGFSQLQESYLVSRLEKKFGINANDFQFAKFIKERHCATMIVHDKYDKQVPVKTVDEIKFANDSAKYVVTDGLGHNRILRDKNVITDIVDFLNTNKDRRVEFEMAFKYGLI